MNFEDIPEKIGMALCERIDKKIPLTSCETIVSIAMERYSSFSHEAHSAKELYEIMKKFFEVK